jgi:hypothetical protein
MQLQKALSNVLACPCVTAMLVGAPGVGKTHATAATLREAGYDVVVVNCQNLPVEDTAALPVVDKKSMLTKFTVPAHFRVRPKVAFVLDELLKAPEDVVNAFLPLAHGRSFMGQQFDLDTPVIITANSSEFKVGDALRPHIANRVVQYKIDDPTPAEAERVMLDLNYDARIISWVGKVPSALVSFDPNMADKPDTETDFYFGYRPRQPRDPFCSMRSLELASAYLKAGITDAESLTGAIGKRAALSLAMYTKEIGVRVDPVDILSGAAQVPANLFDCRMAGVTAASMLDTNNWGAVLAYVKRLPAEIQHLVARQVSLKKCCTTLSQKREFGAWLGAQL